MHNEDYMTYAMALLSSHIVIMQGSNALVAHPKIAEAAVIGVPHPKWQERPVALVVTTDGQELPLSEIHELLADAFAKWQLPETVLYLDQLPRTSVGKLDKKAMRAAHTNVYEDVR